MQDAREDRFRVGSNVRLSVLLACGEDSCGSSLWEASMDPQRNFDVIASLRTLKEAYAQPLPTDAQLALVSVDFGESCFESLELLRRIRSQAPSTKIVLCANACDRRMVIAAFGFGARGMLYTSDLNRKQLGDCLSKVNSGELWIGHREIGWITEALVSSCQQPHPFEEIRIAERSMLSIRVRESDSPFEWPPNRH